MNKEERIKKIAHVRSRLSAFPKNVVDTTLKEILLNKDTNKENINISTKKIDDLFLLQNIVVSVICSRDKMNVDEFLYDLNESYYKELDEGAVEKTTFQYPSQQPMETESLEVKIDEYERLRPDFKKGINKDLSEFKQSLLDNIDNIQNVDVNVTSFIEKLTTIKKRIN